MAYGMAYEMAYGMAYGMAGMADGMVEWHNGKNGGMAYETVLCLRGIVRKGIVRRVHHVHWEGDMAKQSSTKGYEDELQAHFNSII